MYRYVVWPGAYSFKEEIGLFVRFLKDQFDNLSNKIEKTENAVDEKTAVDQDFVSIIQ